MSVNIIWKCAYHVENDRNKITEVPDETNLEDYIKFYIESLNDLKRGAPYQIRDSSTAVVSCIKEIAQAVSASPLDLDTAEAKSREISDRFLEKEVNAQKKIEQLNTIIRNGCLIQACFSINESLYFLIAKLNWETFLEGKKLKLASGLVFDRSALGRYCIAQLSPDATSIKEIQVSLESSKVRYFVDEFLELDAKYNDEISTENCYEYATRLINRTFKDEYPGVRLDLKHAFTTAFFSSDRINYPKIVDTILRPYLNAPGCEVKAPDAEAFLKKLENLPSEKQFSPEFNLVRGKIKPRWLETPFDLGAGRKLIISDTDPNSAKKGISSGHDSNGNHFLIIYTEELEVLRTFEERSSNANSADSR